MDLHECQNNIRESYTIHCMVLLSMALLRQYIPPTAKWYFLPGRLNWAFLLTLLGVCHGDPDLERVAQETDPLHTYSLTVHTHKAHTYSIFATAPL